MFAGLKTWAIALSWPIRIGAALLLLFALWTGWGVARHWWRPNLPKPEPSLEDTVKPAQARIDQEATKKQEAVSKAQAARIALLEASLAKLRQESEARTAKSLAEARAAGPDGLAKLATALWEPGILAKLKASVK